MCFVWLFYAEWAVSKYFKSNLITIIIIFTNVFWSLISTTFLLRIVFSCVLNVQLEKATAMSAYRVKKKWKWQLLLTMQLIFRVPTPPSKSIQALFKHCQAFAAFLLKSIWLSLLYYLKSELFSQIANHYINAIRIQAVSSTFQTHLVPLLL